MTNDELREQNAAIRAAMADTSALLDRAYGASGERLERRVARLITAEQGVRARLARAVVRAERYRASLEAFAAFGDAYIAKLRNEQAVSRDDSVVYRFNDVVLTVGMFRAARAVLEGK